MAEVPDLPEHVAVIVAEPAATPLARPVELTVAADVLLLVQAYGEQLIVLPLASFAVVLSCCVPPTGIDADAGETVTVLTVGAVAGVVAVATFDSAP